MALKKVILRVRDQHGAAYLQASTWSYRLMPSEHSRGYTIFLSVRYNNEWQPWMEVDHFGIDDILCDKWQVS